MRLPLALVLLLATVATASAQEVRGVVTDVERGLPLAGTLLSLHASDGAVRATTVTDRTGNFVLRPVGRDSLWLRVDHFGYAPLESVPLLLARGEVLRLEIGMRPQPLALEGVTATGKPRLRPPLERFLRRRQNSFGRILGPEELEGLPRSTAAMLLASVPGSFLIPGAAGTVLARSRQGNLCQPRIYVDNLEVLSGGGGMPSSPDYGTPVDSYVHPSLIMGVEVYRNPQQAPFEFQEAFMADCPVVLLWTNYSFGIGR